MSKFNVGTKFKVIGEKDIHVVKFINIHQNSPNRITAGAGLWYNDTDLQSLSIEDVQTGDIVKVGNKYFGILFAAEYFIEVAMETENPKEALTQRFNDDYSRAQFIKLAERDGWTLYSPDEVEEEMIDVDGKKWSLSTVKEALKDHAK